VTHPVREELIKVLTEIGKRYPDWRLGQTIANFAFLARGEAVESIWDVEDEELLKAMVDNLVKNPRQ